jgi:formamidopyrimidine-DNA glycosylase
MPELPEVEIQVRALRRRLRGQRITGVESRDPKIRLPADLRGVRIREVTRHGKQILFHLADGRYLLAHLRMTGWFEFREPARWRVAIRTARATAFLEDSRRFGTLTVARSLASLAELGPDALDGGGDWRRLQQTRRAIKVALLDQSRVAGVGNIYACESLWRARIDPRRPAQRLTAAEWRRLRRALAATLRQAIRYGARIFQAQRFAVYDRAGQPCRRCGAPIRRFAQAQRTTFWCAVCQR